MGTGTFLLVLPGKPSLKVLSSFLWPWPGHLWLRCRGVVTRGPLEGGAAPLTSAEAPRAGLGSGRKEER